MGWGVQHRVRNIGTLNLSALSPLVWSRNPFGGLTEWGLCFLIWQEVQRWVIQGQCGDPVHHWDALVLSAILSM